MANKIDLIRMANIVANEAEMLHCSIEMAWAGIDKTLTKQFNFDEVKSVVESH